MRRESGPPLREQEITMLSIVETCVRRLRSYNISVVLFNSDVVKASSSTPKTKVWTLDSGGDLYLTLGDEVWGLGPGVGSPPAGSRLLSLGRGTGVESLSEAEKGLKYHVLRHKVCSRNL